MTVFRLFHWTDNHNDSTVTAATMSSFSGYSNLDGVINTGDMVSNYFEQSIDNSKPLEYMIVIGNHDDLNYSGTDPSGYVWSDQPTETQLYTKFLQPTISSTGITITANTSYWYKDYAAKQIMVIAINSQARGSVKTAQDAWLNERLTWCLEHGYAVVIAAHIPAIGVEILADSFTGVYLAEHGFEDDAPNNKKYQTGSDPWFPSVIGTYNIVNTYADAGLRIIAFITGHEHCDALCIGGNTKKYPYIVLGATRIDSYNDVVRSSSSSQLQCVCSNLYEYDPDNEYLKIMRVGASGVTKGYRRGLAVWDYRSQTYCSFISVGANDRTDMNYGYLTFTDPALWKVNSTIHDSYAVNSSYPEIVPDASSGARIATKYAVHVSTTSYRVKTNSGYQLFITYYGPNGYLGNTYGKAWSSWTDCSAGVELDMPSNADTIGIGLKLTSGATLSPADVDAAGLEVSWGNVPAMTNTLTVTNSNGTTTDYTSGTVIVTRNTGGTITTQTITLG